MENLDAIFRRVKELCRRSTNKQFPPLRKLNDSVYEIYSPKDGTSLNLEIIFFHGLVKPSDSEMAYVETWTSFLDSTASCWPQTLLAKDFPRARILSVSYDSSIKRELGQGNLDLFLTSENLLYDLIDGAKVAANPGLPVILVGKDLGGLVIKAICMEAKDKNRFTFLSNLKGVFYYRTPHLGIQNLPTAFTGALAMRLAFGNTEIARLGSKFSIYRKSKWATRAIISLQESEKVPELVISEASQRYDVDEYYTTTEGIDRVCKCQAKTSSTFIFLTGFISRIERGKLQVESSSDGGRTEDVELKYSLDFENDGSYVPMETTLAEVKNALQRTRIVVLHGGAGTGKTSLARYLALQYEAEAQQGTTVAATCSTEQSDWLPNGVVYMTCGNGAEIISIQRELLRKFNVEVSLQGNFEKLEGAVELQKMYRQKLVDHMSKLQLRVVVVLDDVWEGHLVENLLVPGDRVRYLLTTQNSTVWNAHDSKRVQMQDVTLEDARHILGNYAKFEGGMISEHFEIVADEIIVESGSHPLALATLGIVLETMEDTLEDWRELKNNLKEHLETEEHRPSIFGQEYSLSINASMMFVLRVLNEDAKQLLYQISLFDGPFIPETLLRLFLRYTLPLDEKMSISKHKLSLVAKGLVHVETHMFGDSFVVDFEMRVIRIHSLRQHFILTTKTKEIDRIIDFMDNNNSHKFLHMGESSDLDLATALCALYGATYVKKKALKKMGSHFIWSVEYWRGLALALKPFVSLMLSEGDKESHISQAATKVFWDLLIHGRFDDRNIEILLCKQECIEITCNLLFQLSVKNIELHKTNNGRGSHVAFSIATMPSIINKLVMLLSKDMGITSSHATVLAIYSFAILPQNRVAIVQFPCCLERLVALLAQDVENGIQMRVATCLACLVDCDVRVGLMATPFLLERLVSFLSKDMGITCSRAIDTITGLAIARENRVPIVQFPSCLERFVALLAQDVENNTQQLVATCLTYLVNCDARVEIMATPSLLERLMSFLFKDMGTICSRAITTIIGLVVAPENRVAIVQFPLCLERLVALLAGDVENSIQKEVVTCLTYLVDCDMRVEIMATPFLLERLVSFLSKDMAPICSRAVITIKLLAATPKNRVAIVQFPSCLERLVALLAQDVEKSIQKTVVTCLMYLVDSDMRVEIMATPFLLDRLVSFLSKDMGTICSRAVDTITGLAIARESRVPIVQFPSCLERLVALLAQDVENSTQQVVATCLTYLVNCDARVEIMATPFLLERLVSFLFKDMGTICSRAVNTITGLAVAPENRVAIVQFPSYLERLVALLAQDVENYIQKQVVMCLTYLVDSDVRVEIMATPFLLERLVSFLSEDMGTICDYAATAITGLAKAPENRVAIVQFPSCLERLVALLVDGVDQGRKEQVLHLMSLLDCDVQPIGN